jgi:hypothetical protein
LPQVEWIPVGTRNHRRFTQDDIKLIEKTDEYQKQGFVLRVAAEKAGAKPRFPSRSVQYSNQWDNRELSILGLLRSCQRQIN